MVFISQDGQFAIDASKIDFFYIPKDKQNNSDGVKYSLYVKPSTLAEEFPNLRTLFRHKDLNVVKNVMKFLANGIFLIPYNADNQNVLVVDLPDLYKHGMPSKEFTAEARSKL